MRVRVKLFAGTRDAVGAPALDLDVHEGASVLDVVEQLERAHPKLAAYRDCRILALDGAPAAPDARVREGAVIAIMPPVSGGAGRLRDAPITEQDALASLRVEGAGAVVTFVGRVRAEDARGAPLDTLRFEAYADMAEAALQRVRDEAVKRFGLLDCEIVHRIGDLAPGEPIVGVAVASRHRREAFEAAAWAMEELKRAVPVWKQELARDGVARWVNDPTIGGD